MMLACSSPESAVPRSAAGADLDDAAATPVETGAPGRELVNSIGMKFMLIPKGKFAFGDDAQQLGDHGWYAANGGGQTHAVGQKKPNAWGLYDMHGNAWEWCADWYERCSGRSVIDPTEPSQGTDRVYRSGSWSYGPGCCRSANRTATGPSFEGFDFLGISFRVAMNA